MHQRGKHYKSVCCWWVEEAWVHSHLQFIANTYSSHNGTKDNIITLHHVQYVHSGVDNYSVERMWAPFRITVQGFVAVFKPGINLDSLLRIQCTEYWLKLLLCGFQPEGGSQALWIVEETRPQTLLYNHQFTSLKILSIFDHR